MLFRAVGTIQDTIEETERTRQRDLLARQHYSDEHVHAKKNSKTVSTDACSSFIYVLIGSRSPWPSANQSRHEKYSGPSIIRLDLSFQHAMPSSMPSDDALNTTTSDNTFKNKSSAQPANARVLSYARDGQPPG